jgi:hypothetical protein
MPPKSYLLCCEGNFLGPEGPLSLQVNRFAKMGVANPAGPPCSGLTIALPEGA